MKNSRVRCIFEHNDFVYTVNFEKLLMWVCTEDDKEDPISVLDIKRVELNKWTYRTHGDEGNPFLSDQDDEFQLKLESNYSLYLNQLIAGKNARSLNSQTVAPVQGDGDGLHQAHIQYKMPSLHTR